MTGLHEPFSEGFMNGRTTAGFPFTPQPASTQPTPMLLTKLGASSFSANAAPRGTVSLSPTWGPESTVQGTCCAGVQPAERGLALAGEDSELPETKTDSTLSAWAKGGSGRPWTLTCSHEG